MLTLDDLRRKAGSKYLAALGATLPAPPDKVSELPASPLFPWAIACGKLTEAEAQGSWLKTVAELQQRARTGSRPGYELHEKRVNTGTRYAWQTLPQQVLFATPADLFAFLGKTTEAAAFQRDATLVLQRLPQLHDWLLARPHLQLLLTYAGKWEGLVRVCEYFLERTTAPPAPRRYLRELPIAGVTTKFIEQHTRPLRLLLDALLPPTLRYEESKFLRRYGLREAEPLVRLRLLDEALSETLPFQLDDFAVPISKFRELDLPCETVFMVENLTTFLALPPLPNTVAVWGKGFQVGALKGTDWLNARRLLYFSSTLVKAMPFRARL